MAVFTPPRPAAALAPPLLRLLDDERAAMVELLERLAAAETPAVAAAVLARELDELGFAARPAGASLYARPRGRRRGRARQLLLGRLDAAPGLVVLVFALRALARLGVEPEPTPVLLAVGDESLAEPESTRLVRLLACGAARALVVGPPDASGRLRIARTGRGSFKVTAHDESARPGTSGDASVRAILELSQQVPRLYALGTPVRGVSVRVGEIEAHPRRDGEPPSASAEVVVHAPTAETARRVEAAIRALEPVTRGSVLEVDGGFTRPPMERLARNRALYGAAVRLGRELGLRLSDAPTAPSPSEANEASVHTATLDGLGPPPGDERAVAAGLPERAALLALLLLEPPGVPPPHRLGRGRRREQRVAIVGGAANEANLELVAGWQQLGIGAELVPPGGVRNDDVVLGRLDVLPTLDGTEPGLLELLLFERRGIRVLNPAFATARAHDKLLTARTLARAGVPHPWTVHVASGAPLPLFAPPLVVKPRFGSWGADVYRCESRAELDACLAEIGERPWFRRHGALLQALVPPVGRDLRLLVAGGGVVGAIERVAGEGEWRTNISLGGSSAPVEPPEEACRIAVAAAVAVGADLVGVDLLPLEDGWTVLELNGAVEFDAGYSLAGADVFRAAAAALGLLPAAAAVPVSGT